MDRYAVMYFPEHKYSMKGGQILVSRLVAEEALGKPLHPKHPVHHHSDTQLVICENNMYHKLLHRRTDAFLTCGHANWRKCKFCKQYDDPKNLKDNSSGVYHNKCHNEYTKNSPGYPYPRTLKGGGSQC